MRSNTVQKASRILQGVIKFALFAMATWAMAANAEVFTYKYGAARVGPWQVASSSQSGLTYATPEAACQDFDVKSEQNWPGHYTSYGIKYTAGEVQGVVYMGCEGALDFNPGTTHGAALDSNYFCGANSHLTQVSICMCENGFSVNAIFNACVPTQKAQIGNAAPMCLAPGLKIGNPIIGATGEKRQNEVDIEIGTVSPLTFERIYLSRRVVGIPVTSPAEGFDLGWGHNHSIKLVAVGTLSKRVVWGDGGERLFTKGSGTSWTPLISTSTLVYASPVWVYTDQISGEQLRFNDAGQIVSATQRNGRITTYAFTGNNLSTITGPFGKAINIAYDASGRINSVSGSGITATTYQYDSAGRLSVVTRPGGTFRTYVYEDINYPFALTGIIDERGNRYSTYAYDVNGRGISTEYAGGVEKYQITYPTTSSANVTDSRVTRAYFYSNQPMGLGVSQASYPASSDAPGPKSRGYNIAGLLLEETDFLGTKTLFTWDQNRRLPLTTTEASQKPEARTTTTTWHETMDLPVLRIEPGRSIAWTYNANGQVLSKSVTDTATNAVLSWQWTYNAQGLQTTETGPNNAVTTSTWDSNGNLTKVTNAKGQETNYQYDASGRLLQITDPNGLVTTYSYDVRGRPINKTVGTEVTSYAWDGAGLLTSTTFADNSGLTYTYDPAHRLTQIQDSAGNKMVYTLDLMSKRTKEEKITASNVIAESRSWSYNFLNRLNREIGSTNSAAQYVQQNFDLNGNNTSSSRDYPNLILTQRFFDSLNRMTKIIDSEGGATYFEYDASDNITKVTSPLSVITTYTYDGFGNLLSQVSGDSGTTTFAYNAAGQLQSKTDGRGVVATYTWDELNRMTTITYPDETVTYTYDICTNGKGQLCSVVDKTGTTSFTYTLAGRIATKTQVMGALTQILAYTYNAAGQLTQMTTPTGKAITYTWANGRVTGVSANGTAVIKNATYQPFGDVLGWDWGNDNAGSPNKFKRTFDLDGRITKIETSTAADQLQFVYDAANRITNLQKLVGSAVDTSKSFVLTYDRVDRAKTMGPDANNPDVPRTYTYNSDGNRISQSTGSSPVASTFSAGSNRLINLGTRNFTYDGAGNRLSDGTQTWTYGGNNRATNVSVAGTSPTTIAVGINAMGQRVVKTVNGATTRFVYDDAGRLIGEYDNLGKMIKEHLWFNEMPVGVLK